MLLPDVLRFYCKFGLNGLDPCFDACLEKLKNRILYHTQFDSNFFNIEILEDLIFEKTGREINPNALDMAFGVISYKFKSSTYTLDPLSIHYVYANLDDFYIII